MFEKPRGKKRRRGGRPPAQRVEEAEEHIDLAAVVGEVAEVHRPEGRVGVTAGGQWGQWGGAASSEWGSGLKPPEGGGRPGSARVGPGREPANGGPGEIDSA